MEVSADDWARLSQHLQRSAVVIDPNSGWVAPDEVEAERIVAVVAAWHGDLVARSRISWGPVRRTRPDRSTKH